GVTVGRGHHAGAVDGAGARFVDNAGFGETGEAFSLALAEDSLVSGTLVAFGDIVLKRHLVQALLEDAGEGITLVVDSTLAASATPDRVRAARPDSGRFEFDEVWLVGIGDAVAPAARHGVRVGHLHPARSAPPRRARVTPPSPPPSAAPRRSRGPPRFPPTLGSAPAEPWRSSRRREAERRRLGADTGRPSERARRRAERSAQEDAPMH